VNNLPKVVTQLCLKYELNPRPDDRKSNDLPVAPPRHLWLLLNTNRKSLAANQKLFTAVVGIV